MDLNVHKKAEQHKDVIFKMLKELSEYYQKMFIIFGDKFSIEYPFKIDGIQFHISLNEYKMFIRDDYFNVLFEILNEVMMKNSFSDVSNDRGYMVMNHSTGVKVSNNITVKLTPEQKNIEHGEEDLFTKDDYFSLLLFNEVDIEYDDIARVVNTIQYFESALHKSFSYMYIDNLVLNNPVDFTVGIKF